MMCLPNLLVHSVLLSLLIITCCSVSVTATIDQDGTDHFGALIGNAAGRLKQIQSVLNGDVALPKRADVGSDAGSRGGGLSTNGIWHDNTDANVITTKPIVKNTLFISGFWKITPPDGAVTKHKDEATHYVVNTKANFKFLGEKGARVLFYTNSSRFCSLAKEAHTAGSKRKDMVVCRFLEYEDLPYKEEANTIAYNCNAKFGKTVSDGLMRLYNRIWLSKTFMIEKALENVPSELLTNGFQADNFAFIDSGYDRNRKFDGHFHFVLRGLFQMKWKGIRYDLNLGPKAIAFPPYPNNLFTFQKDTTFLDTIAHTPAGCHSCGVKFDWRQGYTETHPHTKVMYRSPQCGQPVAHAALWVGTRTAMTNFIALYKVELEKVRAIMAETVVTGEGCQCFDEELVFSSVFVQCPECFHFATNPQREGFFEAGPAVR